MQGGILDEKELEGRAPSFLISLIPMVVTFVLINGFDVELLYGLGAGCVLSVLMFWKSLNGIHGISDILTEGFNNGIFPCIIIAAVVGVGKVVSSTEVFALIQNNIINLPLPGLLKVAAITTIIAGITGSASGGLTIALELFGDTFVSWGYTPEIIHRVASIACGGLDTLPWNGTVVMLFALSGVSYKKGYLSLNQVTGSGAPSALNMETGKMGSKEEALDFAEVADAHGWQVVSIDLPEHGERKGLPELFTPVQIIPELQRVYETLRSRWKTVGLYATSMGAWFSMQALPGEELERCLFASPVVDLCQLIEKTMAWSGVTLEQLERDGEVLAENGERFAWPVYAYAKAHPVTLWVPPTTICFGELDHLTDLATVEDFVEQFHCEFCLRKGGRHWFHTEGDYQQLRAWETRFLTNQA